MSTRYPAGCIVGAFAQCPVPGIPLIPFHYGDPARCAKCQAERAQMAAESTATKRKD